MGKKIPIAVARGDGIGPEIMEAVLKILEAAKAPLDLREIAIGEKVYLQGHKTGIEPSSWETIRHTEAFLKAPITTPQGGGFKSLNVTIRTTLGLYANLRPCISYAPYIVTKHPNMDVMIIRENEEDLYAGIEYKQTPDVCHSIKIISQQGTEKIVRFAFEYAKQNHRKKVTCFTKDNIMKLSDGLFHRVFDMIAQEYPEIENEHWIVDIGAAKLADTPEKFDVIVLPNLYGDILSDVAAQITGSVGLVGSANIGEYGAMFEAIHGSAPRRAGQNLANPSGLLQGAILMLIYLGLSKEATCIQNAWRKTIEDGIHTYDIYKENKSKQKVGTQEFAEAVITRLDQKPTTLPVASYPPQKAEHKHVAPAISKEGIQTLVGIDLFIYKRCNAEEMIQIMTSHSWEGFSLEMITNRGVRIYPEGHKETFCIEQWRCRFKVKEKGKTNLELCRLLQQVKDLEVIKIENVYSFS